MAENNAATKEEFKVDANDRKLEAFRAETLARFDVVDEKLAKINFKTSA